MNKLIARLGLPFLFLISSVVYGQKTIQVHCSQKPLSEVLLDLSQQHQLELAYDSELLSQYKITVHRDFNSTKDALQYILSNLPLQLEQSGNVFLILPQTGENDRDSTTQIAGQVLEAGTFEPLPFSYILINHKPVQADVQGNFNFIASADSAFRLQISHLGYLRFDTIITNSIYRRFFLMPQAQHISEVQIKGNMIDHSTLIGDQPGHMKLNHQIAPVLPGYGDNSIFNLLRLMPGIMASGEQSNDLIIWGAYESHSKIIFDGITLFGLRNFNDNISVVNPFVVKNIEVYKGGYDARFGERVGGIVDIGTKNGSLEKTVLTANINATTLNSMLEIPLSKHSSLLAAYRQTYYPLYDATSINLFGNNLSTTSGMMPNNSTNRIFNFEIVPDYRFRDANLKYSYTSPNGAAITFSVYGGNDRFGYDSESPYNRWLLQRSEKEKNWQGGASIQMTLPHRNHNVSHVLLSSSQYQRDLENNAFLTHTVRRTQRSVIETNSHNTVDELRVEVKHTLNFREGKQLHLGAGMSSNGVRLIRYSKDVTTLDMDERSNRIYSFIQSETPFGRFLELKTGLRLTRTQNPENWYAEPRVSLSLKPSDNIRFNAAWGIYRQFISKTTLVDSLGNYSQFWVNSNESDIPVLSAQHWVGGLSLHHKGFTGSLEIFYKTTDGITRYYPGSQFIKKGFFTGKAESKGLDIFLRQAVKKHTFWLAYTLSDSREHFPFYIRNYWQPAPQQQQHEIKAASVLNIGSFYFSCNYVYGSGFERYASSPTQSNLAAPYSRLDAAIVYQFSAGKLNAETGLSVLNILDHNNVKYADLQITPLDEVSVMGIYENAIPFTPTLFLKITR